MTQLLQSLLLSWSSRYKPTHSCTTLVLKCRGAFSPNFISGGNAHGGVQCKCGTQLRSQNSWTISPKDPARRIGGGGGGCGLQRRREVPGAKWFVYNYNVQQWRHVVACSRIWVDIMGYRLAWRLIPTWAAVGANECPSPLEWWKGPDWQAAAKTILPSLISPLSGPAECGVVVAREP